MVRPRCTHLALSGFLAFGAVFAFADPGGASSGACVGDVSVVVDARLDSHVERVPSTTVALPGPVAPGSYVLTVLTSDDYVDRVDQIQPNEQVVVGFVGGPTVGPTPDLRDQVEADTAVTTFEVVLTDPVDTIVVSHVLSGTEEYNSVVVECLSLAAVASPQIKRVRNIPSFQY